MLSPAISPASSYYPGERDGSKPSCMPRSQRTSSIVDRVLIEMHCFVSKQVNSIHTSFIGEDSEGYSGKSLQASITVMKKASQPQLHSKAESEPALPLFFFLFIFRTDKSWPDFLSLTIQTGHDSRKCHKPRLLVTSLPAHCNVHWFSLLYLKRNGIDR